MNIIFGDENADLAREKYTVLKLDTFQFPNAGPIMAAYCTVDRIKFDHMPLVESMARLHHDLIELYGNRRWGTCLELISRLRGFWNGEIDSFYDDLKLRIEQYIESPPPEDWSPIIIKE